MIFDTTAVTELIDKIIGMMPVLLDGTVDVIKIFFWTVILSVPLGFLVALGRNLRLGFRIGRFDVRPISWIVQLYQLIMRGTPLMLQLMFIMYAPYYLWHVSMNRFTATIFAFAINYAAYFGEIFRSGIDSIPRGQYEAAKMLGYTKTQTFFRIILPQVVKRVIPPTGSEFMVLIKDSALANVIGQPQLFDSAKKLMSSSSSILPLVIAGVIFLILNAVVEYAFKLCEKKLNYYKG
ncbi:amino acid ABC transporter permease [Butyricicoccus pullicaecorum]|uniref:amino acid ABC transporter permease n=1 Tax=Butyricicoccus pullicaecorum TaxID=501571 RepID=UPI00268A5C25